MENKKIENPKTPRELINWWLDRIGETDADCRAEVVDACASNPEARKFYIDYAKKELKLYSEANSLRYGF